jgi:aspartate ammonia-lyase
MADKMRNESDSLGSMPIPSECRHGIHTERALGNFDLAGKPVHPALVRSYGLVKLACATTNHQLGYISDDIAEPIKCACREMADGMLAGEVTVDALQGGAGTSTNMAVNEVIANRALELAGAEYGEYQKISPLNHINLHQSTNDTYPTALRLAAILEIRSLEVSVLALQEAFQVKEREFAHIVKVGRTQMQDAVLTTLGREMGAYAEALNRDRWRIYKCEERLRVVNLGGTAIGTGLGAPREYIFRVIDVLREISGVGLARAENLFEATQNADIFVEVSGMLKALAVNLVKISSDLRFLSSGPAAGIGELRLLPRQAGSSIMPGKVNPVIPEAVQQAGLLVQGYDSVIASACGAGNLELNPFLPLVAYCLLDEIEILNRSCKALSERCVMGLEANEERCRANLENSTAIATALLQVMDYEKAATLAAEAERQGRTIRALVMEQGILTAAEFDQLISPEAVCRLGSPARKPEGSEPC